MKRRDFLKVTAGTVAGQWRTPSRRHRVIHTARILDAL